MTGPIYDEKTIWVDAEGNKLKEGDTVAVLDNNGKETRKAKVRAMWMASETKNGHAVSVDAAEITSDRPYVDAEIVKTKNLKIVK